LKRIPTPASRRNRYVDFRRAAGRFIETLELYSSRFFGEDSTPFALTGAFAVGLLTVSLITGALLLFWYVPLPDRALIETTRLIRDVPLGSLILATHRVSADLLILVVLLHLVRNWATGRYRGPRARTWIIGLAALPLVGLIAWAGYVLPWDERAMVLLAWGHDLISAPDRWPIIGWLKLGSVLSWPVFSAENEADLLLRVFALHLGGALFIIWLVMWHLRRVTPPRVRLPILTWIILVAFVLFVAAMVPIEGERLLPFNPLAPPTSVAVDSIACFPLLLYPLLGAPLLTALIALIWLGLTFLPRLEPLNPIVACVHDTACVGCRLCLQDCPYGAIEMKPHYDPRRRALGREIARVIPEHCIACGICVGSCAFGAIELPALTSGEITARIERALEPAESLAPASNERGAA
jgi:ferredoxin